MSLSDVLSRIDALGKSVVAAAASIAAKVDPVIDDAAGAVSILLPQYAVESQAIKAAVDELTAILQKEATGAQANETVLQDVASVVIATEPLIRN